MKLGGVNRYNDLLKIKLEVVSYYLEVKSFGDIKILTFTILSFLAPKTINKMIKKKLTKKTGTYQENHRHWNITIKILNLTIGQ